MRTAALLDRLAGLGGQKWAVHYEARRLAALGEDVIELTIGEPDIPVPPALVAAASEAMSAGRTRYSPSGGEPQLRQAIADKMARRSGRPVSPDAVVAFPGTQAALFAVIMGLAEAGTEVALGDPLYATYEGVVRACGATPVFVPLRESAGYRMAADDLAAAITPATRAVLLNTPHNPTGAVLSAADIAAIGAVCRERDIAIVCDEVYEELIFDTPFASPFDDPALADRTVVVSSISKSHAAPGFRSGWAVGPDDFMARLLPLSEVMLFGGQPFIADMTAEALAAPSEAAATMRGNFARRAKIVVDALSGVAGLRPVPPQAGMFVVVNVAGTGVDGEAFAHSLLAKERVAVMPGRSFGEEARDLVRISLTVDEARLRSACERTARHAARVSGAHLAA